jgi:hypothetical protein
MERSRTTATRLWGASEAKTDTTRSLFFDFGLVHQHDGNVVANGVHAVAFDAFQTALVRLQIDHSLANGADKDFQELFADRHSGFLQFSRGWE